MLIRAHTTQPLSHRIVLCKRPAPTAAVRGRIMPAGRLGMKALQHEPANIMAAATAVHLIVALPTVLALP